ncbi:MULTISPECIES: hypothetical protein [Fischerella]|uniref:Uncharacterized protein n=1 Tax=Fischerella muscicola CCMEE 5323 TaxID=2019572 RepID=A0A2N6K8D3_FISMU|nr:MULTISPECIES: hypothetical protein [Fischerella]MBD2429892.1 hypothetical protein [Fischerella sp. FACHB-380]PLZ93808.1 hypothetical protein CEN44_02235 [Fischerella muscicola CCMEE 5323]
MPFKFYNIELEGEEVAIANLSDAKSPLNLLLIAGVPLNQLCKIIPATANYCNERMGSIDF